MGLRGPQPEKETKSVFGFQFYTGPEIPPPKPFDEEFTRMEKAHWRADWMKALSDAISEHDPWGFIKWYPEDDSIELYDLSVSSIQRLVQKNGTAYVLLAVDTQGKRDG